MSSTTQPIEPTQDQEQDKHQITTLVEEGKKAIALQEWEKACEKYADALEMTRNLYGEVSPHLAPLLLSYGKALFEVAVSSQGVLGREELAKEQMTKTLMEKVGSTSTNDNPSMAFSSSIDPESGEAVTVPDATDDDDGEEADAEDEDPEDEFNEAWEVLDLARTIWEKEKESGKDVERELGECYLLLGDVSLETENFPQAVEDYKSALSLLSSFPSTSPSIAEAHYKLAVVLESTENGREEAIENVKKAIESVEGRKEKLEEVEQGEREKVGKEIEALLKDLNAKLEDLKTAPPPTDPVQESIAHLMGVGSSSGTNGTTSNGVVSAVATKVNDLTSMVKKKAKPAAKELAESATETVVEVTGAESGDLQDVANAIFAKVEGVAKAGFDAVAAAATSIVNEVMEEGEEMTKEAITDVTETVTDALDGLESAAHAGKEKVEQFAEEGSEGAVVGEKRKAVDEGDNETKKTRTEE